MPKPERKNGLGTVCLQCYTIVLLMYCTKLAFSISNFGLKWLLWGMQLWALGLFDTRLYACRIHAYPDHELAY